MFKLNWLRGKAPATNGPPMELCFDQGVVFPDGTVMWLWDGDDPSSASSPSDPERSSNQPSLSNAVHHPEQIHYHYHRFGMGPWLFLGLQASLAIALLLILSPDSQPSAQDAPFDSFAIPQPNDRVGSMS